MVENWMERVCPKCGKEIGLRFDDVRENCNFDGLLTIQCPSCGEGKLIYRIQPPLTTEEITRKALKEPAF